MRIRRLLIKNFRGIKNLEWDVPDDPQLFALIGPGDSGKSTILTAIEYLLGDRWNIPFLDTDFFDVEVKEPICIRALLTDIPKDLLKDSALGLYLCGSTSEHQYCPDPCNGYDPSLEVQLKVDSSLEPGWSVLKNKKEHRLSSSQRRKFGVFSVDPRSDTQLRWSRNSALGKMSATSNADRLVLAEANRAAQRAIVSGESQELKELTDKIQGEINSIGSGEFHKIGAGLDTFRNGMGANLALYENKLPLASYGLGSKRLASLAVQQLSAGARSVALLDEIETGLEPHRVVSLIHALRQDERYSQVFITTHSPIVVEQIDTASLTIVRNNEGGVSIKTLSEPSEPFARLRRSRPSSVLARKILFCEGKTEYGIIKSLVETWDEERYRERRPVSASLGFTFADASGGSEVPILARELNSLGYMVAGFMDNDVTESAKSVKQAQEDGVQFFRWQETLNTETQICSNLDYSQLEAFATNHAEKVKHKNKALKDLQKVWGADGVTVIRSLSAQDWEKNQVDLQKLRNAVGSASHENGWYKDISKGEKLGKWLLENCNDPAFADVWTVLDEIKNFVYREDAKVNR